MEVERERNKNNPNFPPLPPTVLNPNNPGAQNVPPGPNTMPPIPR
jgi:hypothetical protein